MNEVDKRKLNLLVHLAKVDGKYSKSERKLLQQFIAEKGLSYDLLEEGGDTDFDKDSFTEVDTKIELLYWMIRTIQADHIVHEKELTVGCNLASKLNFKKEIVAYYANKPMGDYKLFQHEIKQLWLTGL